MKVKASQAIMILATYEIKVTSSMFLTPTTFDRV